MSRLRLVLGVGRSGTSWLSSVLAAATPPLRTFYEPLYHLRPKLWLRFQGNPVFARPEPQWRFYRAFHLFTAPRANWDRVLVRNTPLRDDPDFQFCLVKEVHALPAMKSLVCHYRVPAIILLRDPLFTLDSIFDAHGLPSPYLHYEERMFREPGFVEERFPAMARVIRDLQAELGRKEHRLATILEKTMAIELVETMLRQIAEEEPALGKVMHYEMLCSDTTAQFQEAARFLGLPWDRQLEEKLASTTRANETSSHKHSIFRDSAAQVTRKWRFLSEDEAKASRDVVNRLRAA